MIKIYNAIEDKLYDLINTDFKDEGGVYTLQCRYSQDSDSLRPIDRILKTDNEGILYIGETKALIERLTVLKKSVKPDYETLAHTVGNYYFINEKIRIKYPIDLLVLKVESSDNPIEKEKELLEIYTMDYGELPPFNSKLEFMKELIRKIKDKG